MSAPGQGNGGGQPYNPYDGRPSSYGPGQGPPYGAPPPYAQQDQTQHPAQQDQFAYNPYGNPYPAGTGGPELSKPVSRPGIMVLSLVLLILSALPYLVFGLLFLVLPIAVQDMADLLPSIDPTGQLAAAGFTAETLISLIRTLGGVITAIAALYILFAVLAFTGRNWARIVLTLLTVGFTLLVVAGLVQGIAATGDAATLAISVGVPLLAVVGTVLLYLRPSQEFFANRRR